MVSCPRCQSPVDEKARATCPICFAPLPAPAKSTPVVPPLPGPALSQLPPPIMPPIPGYAPPAGTRPSPAPNVPSQVAPPQASIGCHPPYVPAPAYRGSSGMSSYMKILLAMAGVGLLIALFAYVAKVVLTSAGASSSPSGGSTFGGFSFGVGSNPEAASLRTPESGAQSALLALHSQDWRKLYYVCAFETNERKRPSDADDFRRELSRAAMIDHNPLTVFNLMAAATQFSCGTASVHGGAADVTTSWTIPYEGETLSLNGSAHMIWQNGNWQLNLIHVGSALEDMLGQVTSRTGHGPAIVIPHFGPFSPHNFPMSSPSSEMRPPVPQPFQRYPSGSSGDSPSYQPGYTPPTNMPGPGYSPPTHMPGPGYMPPTHFPGPGFSPGPRLGPGSFPRGPRFGPPSMPIGPAGGGASPGGGGFGGSSGAFGGSPLGGGGAQSPEGAQQSGTNPNGPP